MPRGKTIKEKLELIKKYADNLARERARFLFGSQYKGETYCNEATDIKLLADQILELLKSEKTKDRQKFIDALIWCSGSDDFQVGGKARKGWEKICLPLLRDEKKNL